MLGTESHRLSGEQWWNDGDEGWWWQHSKEPSGDCTGGEDSAWHFRYEVMPFRVAFLRCFLLLPPTQPHASVLLLALLYLFA